MKLKRSAAVTALIYLVLSAPLVVAEDTDIFASGLSSTATAPRILVVLDNTSNWARQSQQWPSRRVCLIFPNGVLIQPTGGQLSGDYRRAGPAIEVAALKAALADAKVLADANGFVPKIGILEFTTRGTANQDGGYVRLHMSSFDSVQEARTNATLEEIYSQINAPDEKRNSNTAYGNLMYDVYNYLLGTTQSFSGGGTSSNTDSNGDAYPDSRGYSTNYSVFNSPLDDGDVCAETFVIFISNPNQSGPATDSNANSTALRDLYTAAGASPAALAGDSNGSGLPMPEFIEVKGGGGGTESVGYTNQCFVKVQDCSNDINGLAGESAAILAACPVGGSCSCSSSSPSVTKPDGSACGLGGNNGKKQLYSYDVQAPTAGSSDYFQSGGVVDGADFNMDDWTRFLKNYGVTVATGDQVTDSETGDLVPETTQMKVTTFTLDVYNKAPDTDHSALMASAANQGGGYRLKAGNYLELKNALTRILSDILAVNTTFAVRFPAPECDQSDSVRQQCLCRLF